ncbi:hypothetical protein [Nonomuraea maritima]|uniref:hypothetical protein n=1 Tax=Nonomuraea maritima TaxID=683260 RepID=UPI00370FBE69
MFFEPPPPGEALTTPSARPGPPQWFAPPADETGAVLGLGLMAARSPTVAVAVPYARAFSTGCAISVEVLVRQGELAPETAWELHLSTLPVAPLVSRGGDRLPDRLLRFGVRYPGGVKATTVGPPPIPGQEPQGPRLSWLPHAGAFRASESVHVTAGTLWLWPLPPEETFELAVEWPIGGIELTFVPLDGSAVVAAAQRSNPYWP